MGHLNYNPKGTMYNELNLEFASEENFFLFRNFDMVMMYTVILYLKMHFNFNLKKDIH